MQRQPYLSYLLRLWGEIDQGQWIWRASLESVQTGESIYFATLERLLQFILSETTQTVEIHRQPDKRDDFLSS
ncbi:MAG: hypothetical protein U0350_51885 [Caldilineaceae bacterium]